MQGPALSTVTGTTCPSGRKTCVIPIFFPKIPGLISQSQGEEWLSALLPFPKSLNFNVHTRGQIELHQRIHRVLGRLEDIEQTLVRANLKLLPALLVHVR